MIQNEIETELRDKDEGNFIFPDYEGYCLSNITPTIAALLGVETNRPHLPEKVFNNVNADVDQIVFLLVDGLGYEHWKKYATQHAFFERVRERGVVSPLTTIFPSTTSACITSIATGLTPQEHGLPEWVVHLEEIGETIQTLPFATLDDEPVEDVHDTSVDVLFRGTPITQMLADDNIPACAIQSEKTAESLYSQKAFAGSELVPAGNIPDIALKIRQAIEEQDRGYIYAYMAEVVAYAHKNAPHTDEHQAQIAAVAHALQRELVEKLDAEDAKNTLLLVAADHGQVVVDPDNTPNLLEHADIRRNLRSADGYPLYPTGSPRDVFLHVKEEKQAEVRSFLENMYGERTHVWAQEEALRDGLYGIGEVHERFPSRIGDLLVVPENGYTLWYEADTEKAQEFDFHGHHGGLTPEEMLVPFAAANLADLQ